MSVPQGVLTPNVIETNFNNALQAAIDTGTMPGSETGLDPDVDKAIIEVAREYPNATAVSIQNAQQAWRRQVSGASAADDAATTLAVLAKLGIGTGDSLA